jgi:hypothetical protein
MMSQFVPGGSQPLRVLRDHTQGHGHVSGSSGCSNLKAPGAVPDLGVHPATPETYKLKLQVRSFISCIFCDQFELGLSCNTHWHLPAQTQASS